MEQTLTRHPHSSQDVPSDDEASNREDELMCSPESVGSRRDPGVKLAIARDNAALRLKSTFEHIFAKYERDFTGIGDEIDLKTGEIVVDNGHLSRMRHERDTGDGFDEEIPAELLALEEDEGESIGLGDLDTLERIMEERTSEDESEDPYALPSPDNENTLITRSKNNAVVPTPGANFEQKLSNLSFYDPPRLSVAPFQFGSRTGIWGNDVAADPTWQAPELNISGFKSSFAVSLFQRPKPPERYILPVNTGSRSIWAPAPQEKMDWGKNDRSTKAKKICAPPVCKQLTYQPISSLMDGDDEDEGDPLLGDYGSKTPRRTYKSQDKSGSVRQGKMLSSIEKLQAQKTSRRVSTSEIPSPVINTRASIPLSPFLNHKATSSSTTSKSKPRQKVRLVSLSPAKMLTNHLPDSEDVTSSDHDVFAPRRKRLHSLGGVALPPSEDDSGEISDQSAACSTGSTDTLTGISSRLANRQQQKSTSESVLVKFATPLRHRYRIVVELPKTPSAAKELYVEVPALEEKTSKPEPSPSRISQPQQPIPSQELPPLSVSSSTQATRPRIPIDRVIPDSEDQLISSCLTTIPDSTASSSQQSQTNMVYRNPVDFGRENNGYADDDYILSTTTNIDETDDTVVSNSTKFSSHKTTAQSKAATKLKTPAKSKKQTEVQPPIDAAYNFSDDEDGLIIKTSKSTKKAESQSKKKPTESEKPKKKEKIEKVLEDRVEAPDKEAKKDNKKTTKKPEAKVAKTEMVEKAVNGTHMRTYHSSQYVRATEPDFGLSDLEEYPPVQKSRARATSRARPKSQRKAAKPYEEENETSCPLTSDLSATEAPVTAEVDLDQSLVAEISIAEPSVVDDSAITAVEDESIAAPEPTAEADQSVTQIEEPAVADTSDDTNLHNITGDVSYAEPSYVEESSGNSESVVVADPNSSVVDTTAVFAPDSSAIEANVVGEPSAEVSTVYEEPSLMSIVAEDAPPESSLEESGQSTESIVRHEVTHTRSPSPLPAQRSSVKPSSPMKRKRLPFSDSESGNDDVSALPVWIPATPGRTSPWKHTRATPKTYSIKGKKRKLDSSPSRPPVSFIEPDINVTKAADISASDEQEDSSLPIPIHDSPANSTFHSSSDSGVSGPTPSSPTAIPKTPRRPPRMHIAIGTFSKHQDEAINSSGLPAYRARMLEAADRYTPSNRSKISYRTVSPARPSSSSSAASLKDTTTKLAAKKAHRVSFISSEISKSSMPLASSKRKNEVHVIADDSDEDELSVNIRSLFQVRGHASPAKSPSKLATPSRQPRQSMGGRSVVKKRVSLVSLGLVGSGSSKSQEEDVSGKICGVNGYQCHREFCFSCVSI